MSSKSNSSVASVAIVVIVLIAAVFFYVVFSDRGEDAAVEMDLPDVDIQINELMGPGRLAPPDREPFGSNTFEQILRA